MTNDVMQNDIKQQIMKIVHIGLVIAIFITFIGCAGKQDESVGLDQDEPRELADISLVELKELYKEWNQIDEFYYEMSAFEDSGAGTNVKSWKKGENERVDVDPYNEGEFTQMKKDGYFYAFKVETEFVNKRPLTSEVKEVTMVGMDFYMKRFDWDSIESIDVGRHNNADCYVVHKKLKSQEAKIWIHGEYGVPLKIENNFLVEGSVEKTLIIQINNFVIGKVEDNAFDIPDNYWISEEE
ncbi:UNVERIFIED_CONTAM: hypothetical protein Cloal_4156 [Acetivibrio alkalicellulosi]